MNFPFGHFSVYFPISFLPFSPCAKDLFLVRWAAAEPSASQQMSCAHCEPVPEPRRRRPEGSQVSYNLHLQLMFRPLKIGEGVRMVMAHHPTNVLSQGSGQTRGESPRTCAPTRLGSLECCPTGRSSWRSGGPDTLQRPC